MAVVSRCLPYGWHLLHATTRSGHCSHLSRCIAKASWSTNSARHSTTGAIKHIDKITIESNEDAMEIASRLTASEQVLLRTALDEVSKHKPTEALPLTPIQTRTLFLVNVLPFVAFGALDNAIMILAGEYIDQKLGVMLCISTMASAALGNLISDVAGVGLAHYVEIGVSKLGLKHPVLTAQQLDSTAARMTTNFGRAIGLSLGCIIGMFPLFFFDDDEKKNAKE